MSPRSQYNTYSKPSPLMAGQYVTQYNTHSRPSPSWLVSMSHSTTHIPNHRLHGWSVCHTVQHIFQTIAFMAGQYVTQYNTYSKPSPSWPVSMSHSTTHNLNHRLHGWSVCHTVQHTFQTITFMAGQYVTQYNTYSEPSPSWLVSMSHSTTHIPNHPLHGQSVCHTVQHTFRTIAFMAGQYVTQYNTHSRPSPSWLVSMSHRTTHIPNHPL